MGNNSSYTENNRRKTKTTWMTNMKTVEKNGVRELGNNDNSDCGFGDSLLVSVAIVIMVVMMLVVVILVMLLTETMTNVTMLNGGGGDRS